MTQDELDKRMYAGDMTVFPIEDRIATGQATPEQIIEELDLTMTLLFTLWSMTEGE